MGPYFLGVDNKPCIMPIPNECVWNGEWYKVKNTLDIFVQNEFSKDVDVFVEILNSVYSLKARIVDDRADIKIFKCNDTRIDDEGYLLNVTGTEITLQANTNKGVFYGCQTLLQLIANSPDNFICGVDIIDRPLKLSRGVCVNLPFRKDLPRFKRFIDFLAKYKINKIMFVGNENLAEDEINSLFEYITKRHIDIIQDGNTVTLSDGEVDGSLIHAYTGICKNEMEVIGEMVFKILNASCALWWGGYKIDRQTGKLVTPEYLKRILLQLYPMERDVINGLEHLSRYNRSFKTINIREFYNAPLYRLFWRKDDYDYRFLEEAKNISNTVPFSILQGVRDFKLDNAFVLAGNGWNDGIFNIPINIKAKSLAFLHSYIIEKKFVCKSLSDYRIDDMIGYYLVYYDDNTTEKVMIQYGKTISYWRADPGFEAVAYNADPVFVGSTSYRVPYIIYSQEWINAKPDIMIKKVDIVPSENLDDGGIAVLGITAIK